MNYTNNYNYSYSRVNQSNNTRAVQTFVRTLAWIVSFAILGILLALPLISFVSDSPLIIIVLLFNAWVSAIIAKMFYILPEWEKLVLLRLGKFEGVKGAGFFIIPPFIYSVADIVDMRIITRQVEATATLTKDNVPIKVTAAVEYKVEDPKKAIVEVKDFTSSVIWLSTEALKNTIGSLDLKELLSEREQIADSLKHQIDQGAATYGVDVQAVRITDVDTPQSLVEELAVIARARRAAEAKRIQAEAEVLVAEQIANASKVLETQDGGLKLRELQILSEMSKEESSMIIVYPYGDGDGKDLGHAAVSVAQHASKK